MTTVRHESFSCSACNSFCFDWTLYWRMCGVRVRARARRVLIWTRWFSKCSHHSKNIKKHDYLPAIFNIDEFYDGFVDFRYYSQLFRYYAKSSRNMEIKLFRLKVRICGQFLKTSRKSILTFFREFLKTLHNVSKAPCQKRTYFFINRRYTKLRVGGLSWNFSGTYLSGRWHGNDC